MRVVFLTQDAPFYVGRYFDRILGRLAGGPAEVVGLYALPAHVPGRGFLGTLAYYVRDYYGPWLFAKLALKRVWFAIKDTIGAALGLTRQLDSLKKVCRRHGVPFAAPKGLTDEVKAELADLVPDVLFSLGCPVILKRDVIDLPRRACLNIHTALLGDYRGVNPIFWALKNGERTIGVTIHLVTEAIDAGDILMQEPIEMGDDWSIDEAYGPVIETGSRLIAECLARLAAEPGPPRGRPMTLGRYFGFPTRADVRAFRKAGRRFF